MKTLLNNKTRILLLVPFFALGASCGDNLLEGFEETDNVVDATIALDEGDPDKAIELCLDELGTTYKTQVNNSIKCVGIFLKAPDVFGFLPFRNSVGQTSEKLCTAHI